MANNIYIDATANGDGAAAADWSLGRRPIAGDVALFTTAGVGVANNCVFNAPMTCDGLVLAADYGGNVDLVTHNFTLEVSGCTLDGGGTFDMGSGTMTVRGVFDNQHQAVFDDGTSHLIFSGDGNWIGSGLARTLYNVTIDAGVITTLPAAAVSSAVTGLLTVNGEIAITVGKEVYASGTIVTGAAGVISGLGRVYIYRPTAGEGIITHAGTITCGELRWIRGNVAAVLAPGTYAPTLFRVYGDAASADILRLSVGTYNFDCDVQLTNTNAGGSQTFDCLTNTPTVNITEDVLITETAGTCVWTGTIILGGLNNQQYDGDAVAAQPEIAINKITSGNVEFIDADIVWSAAGLTLAETLTLTTGDFDGATNNPAVTCGGLIMDCNNVSMGTGTYAMFGTFDNQHVTTFAANTSLVQWFANGNWLSNGLSRVLYDMTVNAGVVTSVPIASAVCNVQNAFAINGELAIATGRRVSASGPTTIGAAGDISGLGLFRFDTPGGGDGLTAFAGTITCARVEWYRGGVGSVLAAGTYAPTLFVVTNNAVAALVLVLSAGTYNFNCDVELENTRDGGSQTLDCDTNSPTVNITGDVTIIQGGGTAAWTGTVICTGGGNPDITMGGVAAQPSININSAGGTPVFIDGWAGVTFLGTAGIFDPNGQTFAASGNFTTLVGFTAAAAADVMDGCTITVGGNLSFTASAGTPLELLATVAWVLTVTGTTFAHYVEAEYSNAAGGTEIDASDGTNTDGGNNFNWLWDVSSSSHSSSSSSVSSQSSSSSSSTSSSSSSRSSKSSSSSTAILEFPVDKSVVAVGPVDILVSVPTG